MFLLVNPCPGHSGRAMIARTHGIIQLPEGVAGCKQVSDTPKRQCQNYPPANTYLQPPRSETSCSDVRALYRPPDLHRRSWLSKIASTSSICNICIEHLASVPILSLYFPKEQLANVMSLWKHLVNIIITLWNISPMQCNVSVEQLTNVTSSETNKQNIILEFFI